MSTEKSRPVIVVGVDGSAGSQDALRWAVEQADLTGAEVHAVTAWHRPEVYSYASRDYEDDARIALQEAIEKALGPGRGDQVVGRVVAGQPGPLLVDASRDAILLVVGSHGHSEIASKLLGSVSYHCIAHADCTVVVVQHRAS